MFLSQNSIVCLLLAISLLVSGIFSIVYAADNDQLWTDECFFRFGFDGDDFCENLERARDAEIATGVS